MKQLIYFLTIILLTLSCNSESDPITTKFVSDNCNCQIAQDGEFSSLKECEENCIYRCTGTITDVEGNEYKVVSIGDQCWMAENLRVSLYSNGDTIPNVKENGQWKELSTGAWCWYDNDPAYDPIYGKIYNWFTVNDSRGICPKGWRVPSAEDWYILDQNVAEGGFKEVGLEHWLDPNEGATNSSGFTGLPAGRRDGEEGRFLNIRKIGSWFELYKPFESKITLRQLYWESPSFYINPNELKQEGACIRCMRDK